MVDKLLDISGIRTLKIQRLRRQSLLWQPLLILLLIGNPIGRHGARKGKKAPETGNNPVDASSFVAEVHWCRLDSGNECILHCIWVDTDRCGSQEEQTSPSSRVEPRWRKLQFSNAGLKPGGARPVFTR